MNNRIREIRENLGLTRAEFGERIGVSGDVVNNLERGRIDIKEERIKLICSTFNINEEWLRTGKGNAKNIKADDYTKILVDIDKNDKKARQAIIDYWNLSEQDKKLFWTFIDKFIKKDGEE